MDATGWVAAKLLFRLGLDCWIQPRHARYDSPTFASLRLRGWAPAERAPRACQARVSCESDSHRSASAPTAEFGAAMHRELDKAAWLEANGFKLVEVFEEDFDKLSPAWFLETYGITL